MDRFLWRGPLFLLTQTMTQITENRCGVKRNNLRVLGNFRLKKAQKALHRCGWRNRRQLITRRSLVQVQPPQPQKHRFPAGKRCFSLPFCNFGGRPHFLDTEVTQTVTHTGQKTCPEAVFSPPGFLTFLWHQIAFARTFPIVFAASFWAAVVTWA